jgi:hypothetical protein
MFQTSLLGMADFTIADVRDPALSESLIGSVLYSKGITQ